MSDFLSFAAAHGLLINHSRFHPSPKIKRCPTQDKPRSRNGAYLWDGDRGWVCDWGMSESPIWFGEKKPDWTDADKAAWRARKDAERLIEQQKHRNAIIETRKRIQAATLQDHHYLARKGFPKEKGLVDADGELLIPMRSLAGDLQGMQRIFYDQETQKWQKKMLYGSILTGSVFCMGDISASEVFLCEGYATGLSIAAALRSMGLRAAVVVCFSADNLLTVSRQLTGRRFIYADNDPPKLHPVTHMQVGMKGERVAIESGLPYAMSTTIGNDANDDHMQFGLLYLSQQLMKLRKKKA